MSTFESIFDETVNELENDEEEVELDDDAPNELFQGGESKVVSAPVATLGVKKGINKETKQEQLYILQRRKIDNYNVICRRVPLTPAMCTVNGCSFDIAVKNGYDGWDQVPADERPKLLLALEEHVRVVHTSSQAHIITESELPKQWLGAKTKTI